MRIEIWSDIVCPFCTIGKAELDKALAAFPHADEVTIVPRSFELQPGGSAVEPVAEHLAVKYGWSPAQVAAQCDRIDARAAGLGLRYDWRAAIAAPTLDAHRLVKLAATVGLARKVETALMLAHFSEGRDVSDHGVLAEVAVGAGLDANRVAEVLASDEYADAVRADQAEAAALGVRGVPFFVVDGRFGVSGAQSAETFGEALARAWSLTHPIVDLGVQGTGPACGPDGCS
nr:DsbA family oxidoreductase [Propionibacterium sp.]